MSDDEVALRTIRNLSAPAGDGLYYISLPCLWIDAVYAETTLKNGAQAIDQIMSIIDNDPVARQSVLYASRIKGLSAFKEVYSQAASIAKWFVDRKAEMFEEPVLISLSVEILGQITIIEKELLDGVDMECLKTDPGYPGSFDEITALATAKLREIQDLCGVLDNFHPLYKRFTATKLKPEQLRRSAASQ